MLLGSRYDEPVDCYGALILPRLALVVTDVRDEDRVPDRKALLQAARARVAIAVRSSSAK